MLIKRPGLSIFSFISLLMLFMSCSKVSDVDDRPADPGDPNNGITTCEFAPYTDGSTFRFRQLDSMGQYRTIVWKVDGEKEIQGKTYARISGMLDQEGYSYFNCEEGLYHHRIIDAINGVVWDNYNVIYFNEHAALNESWSSTAAYTVNGIITEFRYDMTFVRIEDDVSVEAGIFHDVRVISRETFEFIFGIPVRISQDEYFWASGAGLIMAEGSSAQFELIDFDIK